MFSKIYVSIVKCLYIFVENDVVFDDVNINVFYNVDFKFYMLCCFGDILFIGFLF